MKTTTVIIVSLFASMLLCQQSFAKECTSDLNCDMFDNEKCIIPAYDRVGVCVKSSVRPEKEHKPVSESPTPSPLKKGQFCMTDNDCGPGQSCIKKENTFSGTCR